MRLTDKSARELVCPPGVSERTFFDDDLPGFGLRIRPSGNRSWLAQYAIGGRTRKLTLGNSATVSAGAARAAAQKALAAVKTGTGVDPAAEKAANRDQHAITLGSLLPSFLERAAQLLKPKTLGESTRHLTRYCAPLHATPVARVERRAIAGLLEDIARERGPVASNKTRAALSSFFDWAAHRGVVDTNPVSLVLKAVENRPRSRALSNAELAAVYNAVEGMGDYADIIRLLVLLGLRRSEVADLDWSEIDLEAALIELPPTRTKTGKAHTVPLSPQALTILKARPRDAGRDRVFAESAFSQRKRALDAVLGDRVAPWVLHDLRRTMSTHLHGEPFSVAPHVVESLLGHSIAGVAGVYNKQQYFPERRAALAAWGEHIERIAGGAAILTLRQVA
jgi:integrase